MIAMNLKNYIHWAFKYPYFVPIAMLFKRDLFSQSLYISFAHYSHGYDSREILFTKL